ncbi:methyltransferase domain-containing protein [Candidatus Parcubacteria bacterium]|nr:methyltransferase domain-containing protein [Candidatus Parcubacteria bacterium]
MKNISQIKNESINEFGSKWTQDRYAKIAELGFWKSEEMLINKYFKPKSKILDIGCGSGRTAIPLSQNGFDVIGVDITPRMIESAKKISSSKNLDIDYRIGDATDLEFPDNYFDGAIFANNGWVQIPGKENRQKALAEIHRTMKPNGYFILVAHQRYHTGNYLFFWIIQWIKFFLLKPLGFKFRELDFGDHFFTRPYKIENKKVKQFIHMTSKKEVEEQIKKTGFKIELRKRMGELSKEDVEAMEASMSKNFNSFKSPIFYICKK